MGIGGKRLYRHSPAMTAFTTPVTLESVTDWKWESSSDHRGRVPAVPQSERIAFSSIMDMERPTRDQIKLREAIRRKLSYRISREIGW
jgi:hypothetical protein